MSLNTKAPFLHNTRDLSLLLNSPPCFLSPTPSAKFEPTSTDPLASLLTASPFDSLSNSFGNKPPLVNPWFARFKKPDPLINRNNDPGNNTAKVEMSSSLNGSSLSINKSDGEGLVKVKDENVKFQDVDFWLVFEKRLIRSTPEVFVEDLKNQFETINIVKIKQYFYLEKDCDSIVTGWKLFDSTLVHEVTHKTKKLFFNSQNQTLSYEIIPSQEDLRKHLKKIDLDQKLRQLDLFKDEYVTPLLKLQMQGLFYYEFDYADICPSTLCIVCGLPPTVTDDELTSFISQENLPEPINILRNPLEGQTHVRLSFSDNEAVDLLRFQGLKIPINGEQFKSKPLILIPVKDRNYDYLTDLIKFQVRIDFEQNGSKPETTEIIQFLKEIETRYGLISDVNLIDSKRCIVSFENISSASKCLDLAKFEKFSLNTEISKPLKVFPCTGYLFQNDPIVDPKNDKTIVRPAQLARTDPSQLKIPSKLFEKSMILKKRYQKIYLVQKEEAQKRALQPAVHKIEENGSVSASVLGVKYEQISNSSFSNEAKDLLNHKETEKSAKEMIEEVTKPAPVNGKRKISLPEEKEIKNNEEDDEATFEDFNIKILQPITDDLDYEFVPEPEPIKVNPTKKLRTETRKEKLLAVKKSRSVKSQTSSRSKKRGVSKLKAKGKVVVLNQMEVEGRIPLRATQKNRRINYATMTRDELLRVRKGSKDQRGPKGLRSKEGSMKPKKKIKRKYTRSKIPIRDPAAELANELIMALQLQSKSPPQLKKERSMEEEKETRDCDSPLINFTIHNEIEEEDEEVYHQQAPKMIVKHEEENPQTFEVPKHIVKQEEIPRPVKIEQIESNIVNVKVEHKELGEEEFGMGVEILIPDMTGLFLSRELRQLKNNSKRPFVSETRGRKKQVEENLATVEERRKFYIKENIKKIKDLIKINKDIRKQKNVKDDTRVKREEQS